MAACSIAGGPIPQSRLGIAEDLEGPFDQTSWSDEALVEAAKIADTGAFAQLIERHQRSCLCKAFAILRNRGDAEDEVQSAWAQAWKHLESYHGPGCFGAWLGRIVSNQCLMRLRKARLGSMASLDEMFDHENSFRLEAIDKSAVPEQVVGDDEVRRLLNKEIRRVPPLLREVLVMRDLHQLDIRDIAARLEISVPATKSRLMRARAELRKRFAKHLGKRGCGNLLQKPGGVVASYIRTT
jgi:RNA polymerase sigma-70 factor (ECF subfamily)